MIEDTFSGSGVGEVTHVLRVDREECSQGGSGLMPPVVVR